VQSGNTDLYLCLEPIIVREHPGNRFLNEIVSPSACLSGQIMEFGLLTLWQMYFHGLSVSLPEVMRRKISRKWRQWFYTPGFDVYHAINILQSPLHQ
jgi:hypothetical protein